MSGTKRCQKLEDAAQAYEDYAGEVYATNSAMALERKHDGRARWVALTIGNTFRALFGSPMYGLTARSRRSSWAARSNPAWSGSGCRPGLRLSPPVICGTSRSFATLQLSPEKSPLKRRLLKFRKWLHLSGMATGWINVLRDVLDEWFSDRRRQLRSRKACARCESGAERIGPPYAYFGKPSVIAGLRWSSITGRGKSTPSA